MSINPTPIYHTPRCRITWTNVASGPTSNVVDTDSVKLYQPLHLFIGADIDPSVYLTAGYFWFACNVYNTKGELRSSDWTGWTATDLPRLPGGSGWYSWYFPRAIDFVRDFREVFLFRPSIHFSMWGPGGTGISPIPDEFAIAEAPHYFMTDY
jgi:hypothetical protein